MSERHEWQRSEEHKTEPSRPHVTARSFQEALQPFITQKIYAWTEPIHTGSIAISHLVSHDTYAQGMLRIHVGDPDVGKFVAEVKFTPAETWADVLLDGLTIEQFAKTRITITPWSAFRPATWRDFVNVEEARPLRKGS